MATRKKIMKHKEMVWRTNRKLSDLEGEAKERAQDLLQRASQLQAEQEEELRGTSKVGASLLRTPRTHCHPLPPLTPQPPPGRAPPQLDAGKAGVAGEGLMEGACCCGRRGDRPCHRLAV